MNELRDKDGVGIYDCPEDRGQLDMPKSAAHEAALQDALNERDGLAYQALGMLSAMKTLNMLPQYYSDQIRQICNGYDAITDKLVAILAKPK